VSEKEGGLDYLRVIDMKTKQSHRITTDESALRAYSWRQSGVQHDDRAVQLSIDGHAEFVYDYDMNTRQRKLLKQQEVLAVTMRKNYEARRIWGARVTARRCRCRLSIKGREVRRHDATAAHRLMVLMGVDAPTFSSNRLALLDRGVIFALAYIRGAASLARSGANRAE